MTHLSNTMKPLLWCLSGVVVLVVLRLFISPFLSMKAIGEARSMVYKTYEPQSEHDPTSTQIADSVERALHEAHLAWTLTDLAFDGLILVVVGVGAVTLVRRSRSTSIL